MDAARAAMEAFIEELPAPAQSFSGAGVVIAAGGLDYLTNAWVAVTLLQEHGCTLPIQIWHLGGREMPGALGRLFQAAGVECVDAEVRFAEHGVKALRGWALKPFAVVACPFRHVLLLDADNVPVRDPSHLFDSPDYWRTGALFWPDRQEGSGVPGALLLANHPIWALTGVPYRGDPSFESGQLCVDKQRCWRELRLALWMNEHADFWYRYLYGDKDTFHIAWRKLGRAWAMPSDRPVQLDRRVFSQVDFDGRVLFQHRSGDKWRLAGDNPVIPTFAHEGRCREALADLRARLLPAIGVGNDPLPPSAAKRLLWRRPGQPPRILGLQPGGIVDGQDEAARLWRLDGVNLVLIGNDLRESDPLQYVARAGAWLSARGDGTSLTAIAAAA
jgi:hypothetical protein